MAADQVNILDGNTFVVSDQRGDIEATPVDPSGLFAFDTRFLSTWVLSVDGRRLDALSVDDLQYFESRHFLVPATGTIYVNATLSIVRRRAVGDGFHEELTVLNHGSQSVDVVARIDAAADFADIFEVKDHVGKKGTHYRRVASDELVLGYERDRFRRETTVRSSQPAQFDEHGLTLSVHVEPHGSWSTDLDVVTRLGPDKPHTRPKYGHVGEKARPMAESLRGWLADAPELETDRAGLISTYRRSLIDLAALRFAPPISDGASLPAAGLPWFMAVFGRDSIIASLQALPFAAELARTTLLALARMQGQRIDTFREEEPGRILHEIRYGETVEFHEQPHSPYYGAADSTQLFVVLLDEYERWTGDTDLVRRLEPHARAALRWIDEYADKQGNGYVSYQRTNEQTGLENQCWKDSWDAINYRDGRLPGFPRATCELQGYTYDAKVRAARLARDIWGDEPYARQLEEQAADLKRRFNQDFWIADRGYFALALDRDGSTVDSLSSNVGHLLWSGIVEDDKAQSVVDHLMGPGLFSGWGVRTLAQGQERYNPIGYHNGTVWPFDNSIIAWGLRRYGYKAEAASIASAILDAAEYFHGRLPEAFAGYDRSFTEYPVEYPTACSPQAWSAGTPLLLLRTMLGLDTSGQFLVTDPAVPPTIERLTLLDIPGRWGRADAIGRGQQQNESRRSAGHHRSRPEPLAGP